MVKLDNAISSLRECDKQLRHAIAEAAAKAEPGQLNRIVGWLTDIQRILIEAEVPVTNGAEPKINHPVVATEQRTVSSANTANRRVAKKYPLFHRDGEQLIKVGWSKSSRDEYEHKAPKASVMALALALETAGKNRRKFTMDKVIPVQDAKSGEAVPDYQSYLALAWMRDELKLVVQHGRQGYTLATESLVSKTEQSWAILPARS
jgi:hypothetical protein